MSNDAHPREALGAFVLGALDPQEARDVAAHVAGCPRCRAERNQLAGTTHLLGQAPEEAWTGDLAEPSELAFSRLLGRVVAERTRARRRASAAALAVGAAAASVVAGIAWGIDAGDGSGAVTAPTVRTTAPSFQLDGSTPARGVSGHVEVVPVGWGTKLDVELDGVEQGLRCRLVVVDRSGQRWNGGSWTVSYGGSFYWSGAVAIPEDRIAAVDVVTMDGVRLLHMT